MNSCDFMNSGVRILATAHAESFVDVRRKKSLEPLFRKEVFDVFAGLSLVTGKRVVDIQRIGE